MCISSGIKKSKPLARGTPYILWRDHRADFEMYQSLQGTMCFEKADYIASFVVPPTGETLFAGLYKIESVAPAAQTQSIRFLLKPSNGCYLYALFKSELLHDYIGRLAINWGAGYIAWHQRAEAEKTISELRLRRHDEPFPDILLLQLIFSQLQHLPPAWKNRLGEVKGVIPSHF